MAAGRVVDISTSTSERDPGSHPRGPCGARPGGHRRPPRSVDPPPAGTGRPRPDRRLRLRRPEPAGGRIRRLRPASRSWAAGSASAGPSSALPASLPCWPRSSSRDSPWSSTSTPTPPSGVGRRSDASTSGSAVGDGVAVTWRDATERYEQHRRFELLVDNVRRRRPAVARRHPGVGVGEPVSDCSLDPEEAVGRLGDFLVHPGDRSQLHHARAGPGPDIRSRSGCATSARTGGSSGARPGPRRCPTRTARRGGPVVSLRDISSGSWSNRSGTPRASTDGGENVSRSSTLRRTAGSRGSPPRSRPNSLVARRARRPRHGRSAVRTRHADM